MKIINTRIHGLKKIKGMFPFALWDDLDRELYLARDIAGEKPLYFYSKKSGSDQKA